MTLVRKVFPEMVETWWITSPYDYLGVNNAVRLSDRSARAAQLLPVRGLGAVAGLADYIREVKSIRDDLSEEVFFGRVLGHEQIQLGHEPPYGIEYAVYRISRPAAGYESDE